MNATQFVVLGVAVVGLYLLLRKKEEREAVEAAAGAATQTAKIAGQALAARASMMGLYWP